MAPTSWQSEVTSCPMCESVLVENFDIDGGMDTMVCEESDCCRFKMRWFAQLKMYQIIIDVGYPIKNEEGVLAFFKHCTKCGGPLGTAGPDLLCDGLSCTAIGYRTMQGERFLVLLRKREGNKWL